LGADDGDVSHENVLFERNARSYAGCLRASRCDKTVPNVMGSTITDQNRVLDLFLVSYGIRSEFERSWPRAQLLMIVRYCPILDVIELQF
jgi:hypothetical protein